MGRPKSKQKQHDQKSRGSCIGGKYLKERLPQYYNSRHHCSHIGVLLLFQTQAHHADIAYSTKGFYGKRDRILRMKRHKAKQVASDPAADTGLGQAMLSPVTVNQRTTSQFN